MTSGCPTPIASPSAASLGFEEGLGGSSKASTTARAQSIHSGFKAQLSATVEIAPAASAITAATKAPPLKFITISLSIPLTQLGSGKHGAAPVTGGFGGPG